MGGGLKYSKVEQNLTRKNKNGWSSMTYIASVYINVTSKLSEKYEEINLLMTQ